MLFDEVMKPTFNVFITMNPGLMVWFDGSGCFGSPSGEFPNMGLSQNLYPSYWQF
jgi:hypothetical protein